MNIRPTALKAARDRHHHRGSPPSQGHAAQKRKASSEARQLQQLHPVVLPDGRWARCAQRVEDRIAYTSLASSATSDSAAQRIAPVSSLTAGSPPVIRHRNTSAMILRGHAGVGAALAWSSPPSWVQVCPELLSASALARSAR
jgi:hypothetical protein